VPDKSFRIDPQRRSGRIDAVDPAKVPNPLWTLLIPRPSPKVKRSDPQSAFFPGMLPKYHRNRFAGLLVLKRYSWGKGNSDYYDPNFGASGTGAISNNPLSERLDGVIGGGQIGYNWQDNNNWVLGLEADIQGSSERGSSSFSDPYSVGVACDIFCSAVSGTMHAAIDWFGTVRGRVGVLATPTALLYVTGGLAYGGVNSSGTITDPCFSGKPPACTAASWGFGNTSIKAGWTVGGGVEGVIPNSTNWTYTKSLKA
jgi:opacity protein-like surface antigen